MLAQHLLNKIAYSLSFSKHFSKGIIDTVEVCGVPALEHD